jgi:transposase
MAKRIDWEKVKKLSEKGYSVPEIAKKLKMAVGTLYNNKDKWEVIPLEEVEAKEKAGEIIGEVLAQAPESTPINNGTTAREIIEVKEFYKDTMGEIRGRIKKILKGPSDEETFKELQLLEKLVKIVKESRVLDYDVNDILLYRDVVSLEIMVKKLELDTIKTRV